LTRQGSKRPCAGTVTEILINYMESAINRIILLDEDIDDDKLRRQIGLLFKLGK